MSQSTDAYLYFGLNVCHDDDGDYPEAFEEKEEGGEFLEWLEDKVKEFSERRGLKLEVHTHCCYHCAGYIVNPEGYFFMAWRGEPQHLEDALPEVHSDVYNRLVELAQELKVNTPEKKIGWWLASYGEV